MSAERLAAERIPFVQATVVRAQAPSSARAGDMAIVAGDGTIEGFVGGVCAEESVRLHALRALETGEPLLLRIMPSEGAEDRGEGYVTVSNPCLSGGGLEIFLQPRLPAPRVLVVGDTPIASALAELGGAVGFEIVPAGGDAVPGGDELGVVVAAHGRDEEAVLAAALEAGVPYVGLVASRRRGAAVSAALPVDEHARARLRTPAGLDIGAATPAEVALSILAELVATRRARTHVPTSPAPAGPATATDPICGMEVAAIDATLHLDAEGGRVWFCSEHCRAAFAEHARAG